MSVNMIAASLRVSEGMPEPANERLFKFFTFRVAEGSQSSRSDFCDEPGRKLTAV